jgi:hypothetical protein
MADGLLGKCKSCTKQYSRDHYREHRDERTAYERARFQEPERRAYAYRQAAKHRVRHPDRYAAHSAVSNAVRDGRLFRQPCEACGAAKAEAHHDDYAKPLDVRWLCKKHHHEHHAEERAVNAQPSSTPCPACAKCKRAARFVRAAHSSGDGWQVRAWCDGCQADAVPGHIWWSKKLFTAEQLAALEPQPALRSVVQQLLLGASNGNDGRHR